MMSPGGIPEEVQIPRCPPTAFPMDPRTTPSCTGHGKVSRTSPASRHLQIPSARIGATCVTTMTVIKIYGFQPRPSKKPHLQSHRQHRVADVQLRRSADSHRVKRPLVKFQRLLRSRSHHFRAPWSRSQISAFRAVHLQWVLDLQRPLLLLHLYGQAS